MQKNLWVKIIDWAVIKVIVVFGKLGTMETRDASPHHVHPPHMEQKHIAIRMVCRWIHICAASSSFLSYFGLFQTSNNYRLCRLAGGMACLCAFHKGR